MIQPTQTSHKKSYLFHQLAVLPHSFINPKQQENKKTSTSLVCIYTLVKMVQLAPLTYERMRKNEEKREGKIRPPDFILGQPWLHCGAALTPFRAALSTVFILDLLEICKNRGPYFLFMFLLISFDLLVCERGELYNLNEPNKQLQTRQTCWISELSL